MVNVFFIVLARDKLHVQDKLRELRKLNVPFAIVCGEKSEEKNVFFRSPKGKYDAINFGFTIVPKNTDIVVLNDVDTRVHNFELAITHFVESRASLLFSCVKDESGPQRIFYKILDTLRRNVPIAASGELMIIKYSTLSKILPIKPCKAEDSLILFKVLEFRERVIFFEGAYVTTTRTDTPWQEANYKRRTTSGLYQALGNSHPPASVRVFYLALPYLSVLFVPFGATGQAWAKGMLNGYIDYLRGDNSGTWSSNTLE
jgi:cellulose synthase/poly-beta-1,6-N-acetylglucosamine synthase-like glycosyltransferase